MKSKIILGIVIFILVGLLLVRYFNQVQDNIDFFVNSKIQQKIIRVEKYFEKSINFYYDEQHSISTFDTKKDTLIIGDSIYKEQNDSIFKVFRKNSKGHYVYYNEYRVNKEL